MMSRNLGRCKFGAFELDPGRRALLKNGRKLKLQDQPFRILTALIERSGEVVTREELRQRLWPAGTFVDFDNSLSIAVGKLRQALNDDAGKPRYIETLPRVGYRFVAAVDEEPQPAANQERAVAIQPILQEQPVKSRQWRWILGLTSMLVLVGLAAWIPFSIKSRAVAAVPLRPSVAVMGFRNLAARPEREWESTALSEWLAMDLEDGERVRTIPGESVARTKIDLALPEVDGFSPSTLSKIRANTGADYVVAGSFFDNSGRPGETVRLDLRMQDTRQGQTVVAVSRSGSPEDLPGLVKVAGLALRQKLGVGLAAQADTGAPQTGPANPATASLYFGGLDKLRHFDALGARDLLQRAVAAEPNNALAHHALSQAWAALGYAERAKMEAQKAWQLSGKLPRPDRLSIEAGYREANVEWDRAIRIYRQLASLFPDEPEYGLRLSRSQIKMGLAREALATLEKLRTLPSPVSDEAAILLAQSEAAGQLGDFEQARRLAAASASAAQARGAQILVAQGRDQECRNLIQLSHAQEAAAACESAKQIYGQAGDRAGLASSMGYLASTRFMLGDLPGARTLYSQALAIDRELGNEGAAQWEHNGLATVLWQEGDLSAARGQYEESLRSARLIDSRPDQADALENIGFMWMLAGDLSKARTMLDEALSRFQAMADKAGAGSVWNNLGQTRYLAGDLPGAAHALSKAVAVDRDIGYKQDTADALMRRGRVYLAQADWNQALRVFDESARIAQQSGSPVLAEQSRVAAAELSLATGRAADAEKSLRESLALFERENRRGQLLEARTLLAQALLAQGKAGEARQEVERAAVSARATQQLDARLEFAIVSARVRAASGKVADRSAAVLQLHAAAGEAARHGLIIYGLQARLILAQLPAKTGDLEKLESEARALGFEAIARQAAAARAESIKHS